MRCRAERLCLRPARRSAVDVVDGPGTYGGGEHGDVEPDRRRAAHDQDLGPRRVAQRGPYGAPGVRQVVARAGDRSRVESLGQGHERLRGPRDTHELVEQATPVSAERHAVHRIPRNPLALRREAPQATSAATATDVPWDDHVLAPAQRPGIVADVDDLGDALMADCE